MDDILENNPRTHLQRMLSIMDVDATITEEDIDPTTRCYRIDCSDRDAKILIGRKGQTLETMQFLLRQMCKGVPQDHEHIVLDVRDYRIRREHSIVDRAKEAAVAVLNGEYEEFGLQPMSAFERRIVHNYLKDHFPELSSVSRGQADDRHIVVSYAGLPGGESEAESDGGEAEA